MFEESKKNTYNMGLVITQAEKVSSFKMHTHIHANAIEIKKNKKKRWEREERNEEILL